MRQFQKLALLIALTMSANFSSHVSASDTDYVYFSGQKFIEFEFFNEGEFGSQYTLPELLRDGTKDATSYWSGILALRSKFSSPWQIFVKTQKNLQNAGALTYSLKGQNVITDNYPALMMQDGKKLNAYDMKKLAGIVIPANISVEEQFKRMENYIKENAPGGDAGLSLILIGQHLGAERTGTNTEDGWWVDPDTILPTNEQATDFVGTFRHELGHALGILIARKTCDWDGNVTENDVLYGEGKSEKALYKFADDITDKNSWSLHLVDKNGNHAKPGMMIVTTDGFNIIKKEKPGAVQKDYFIVDDGDFAYFVGNHVTEALAGAKFNGVSGLPVNAWEGDVFEGSHLQTAGMMSHRDYSNYTAFMEAELAVMQDLGYDIDRKAYFGYSVYGNNQTINNTHGYSARNAAGTAYTSDYSLVPLGIGLHVYGAGNTITQSANILTKGIGATGIRVDGEKNTINVPKTTEIHADGKNGKGILIAYGRHQNLNLAGNVTASKGNAVEFNFGASTNGASDEYRGSYIRFERKVNSLTGDITTGTNLTLNDMNEKKYNASADELVGELITDFDLSGKIAGGENAIYIGRNAFVKNINVKDGAEIKMNITSEWKHFSKDYGFWDEPQTTKYDELDEETNKIIAKEGKIEPLCIQYNGKKYVYNQYIPDLVTNLNFNGDINYSGNITGADNMKLSVIGGRLTYGGTADVVNVKVAEGAYLYGGTFTVNDMSSQLATGFSDNETGTFINHGTIGASSADTNQVINGNLESDGTLEAYAGGKKGQIEVSGTANVNDSTVSVTHALPDETLTVLTAGTVNGNLANPAGKPYKASGMLVTTGEVDHDTVKVTAQAANNLGEMTAQQAEAYEAMNALQQSLKGDDRRAEMRPLYSLNANNAKQALMEISSSTGPQMVSVVQQSTLASQVISDRLSTAFSMWPVEVTVPINHLADSGKHDDGVKMNMELPVPQDNNAWVKFTKNWGELKGGASYHGSAIYGGYDRRLNDKWRGGLFLSYQTMGLGAESSSANIYDTRVGIYAGYHKDAADAYIYADYGWIRNKQHRSLGMLGLGADAKYNAHLMEIGGEYKYDLHASDGRTWHVSPYVGFQLSWLNQSAYTETGAGIFNQRVAGKHNTYFAGQLGMELKRYLKRGSYGLRLGVKHAFAGADPNLSFCYEGNGGSSYTLRNSQDKTHLNLSLFGENEFAKGWFLSGEAQLLKGDHDKDVSASIQFKRVW